MLSCAITEDKINDMEIGDKLIFEYSEDTLNLSTDTSEFLGSSVFIEKKDTNDHVVEITNYLSPVYVDHINLTKKSPSMGAVISDNTLILQAPQPVNIVVSKVKKEFTIMQFTGDSWLNNKEENNFGFGGENILYIKVPKELEIISSMDNTDITIHYVGE